MRTKTGLFLILTATIIVFSSTLCHAQLAMKMAINSQNYLQYEDILAKVVIRNDSGHAVVFGHDDKLTGKLLFEISDSQENKIMKRGKDDYPITGTILHAGETKEFIIPLNQYYQLTKLGRYRVKVYISHSLFKNEYISNECIFEVSAGTTIWSRTVGIPDFLNENKKEKIQTRTYNLKSLTEGSDKIFYLVVEDDKMIYATRRIGFELGEEKFTCDVDMLSQIHILLPISPAVFNYFIYDINGKQEKVEVYKKTKTIPSMLRDPKTGRVYVVGGEQAKEGTDYKIPDNDKK
ncbi:MAG: hypothetical protein WC071_03910 [Victivallaceae bacterium]